MANGTVELMVGCGRGGDGAAVAPGCAAPQVHRRLLYDDSRGVGEPLNETVRAAAALRARAPPPPNAAAAGHGMVGCSKASLRTRTPSAWGPGSSSAGRTTRSWSPPRARRARRWRSCAHCRRAVACALARATSGDLTRARVRAGAPVRGRRCVARGPGQDGPRRVGRGACHERLGCRRAPARQRRSRDAPGTAPRTRVRPSASRVCGHVTNRRVVT